jgi:hypothetical protein
MESFSEEGDDKTEKKGRRVFTPEQKFKILKDIETFATIKGRLERYLLCYSVCLKWKWKRQVNKAT